MGRYVELQTVREIKTCINLLTVVRGRSKVPSCHTVLCWCSHGYLVRTSSPRSAPKASRHRWRSVRISGCKAAEKVLLL
jgi:hypothetical protein